MPLTVSSAVGNIDVSCETEHCDQRKIDERPLSSLLETILLDHHSVEQDRQAQNVNDCNVILWTTSPCGEHPDEPISRSEDSRCDAERQGDGRGFVHQSGISAERNR